MIHMWSVDFQWSYDFHMWTGFQCCLNSLNENILPLLWENTPNFPFWGTNRKETPDMWKVKMKLFRVTVQKAWREQELSESQDDWCWSSVKLHGLAKSTSTRLSAGKHAGDNCQGALSKQMERTREEKLVRCDCQIRIWVVRKGSFFCPK